MEGSSQLLGVLTDSTISFMLMMQLILKKVIPDMYYVRYALTGMTITFLCPFMFHMLRLKSE
ncbi:hypothetical protein J0835_10800 [Bacillus cereus group sp. Sample62]|nr:hypothetical protein [Bacillus cereus]HDX9548742.1 hypothetical protein [Bacillus thuringiensis]